MIATDRIRLLLVEDNPADVRIVRESLTASVEPHVVITVAGTLREALERLDADDFDAVLLDLRLPDSSDDDVCGHIGRVARSIPVIVLTGDSDETTAIKAVTAGAQDYIIKDELLSLAGGPRWLTRSVRYAIERFSYQQEHLRDLEQLDLVLRQLPAVVWTTDSHLVVTSCIGRGPILRFGDGNSTPIEVGTIDVCLQECVENSPMHRAHRRALGGQSSSIEVRTEGRIFQVRIEPSRAADGSVIGTVGIALDVSRSRSIEEHLSAARQVQRSLFPSAPPEIPGWEFGADVYPTAETGGDYFDYVTLPDGSTAIVVADVSGHGLAPALLTGKFSAYVRSLAKQFDDPATIFTRINEHLYEELQVGHFVTAFMAVVNPKDNHVRYAAAGHAGYVLRLKGDAIEWDHLPSTGPLIGFFTDVKFETNQLAPLAPGEMLFLPTDGFHETMGPDEELFGIDALLELVQTHRTVAPDTIISTLHTQLLAFAGEDGPRDDMTAVIVRRSDR